MLFLTIYMSHLGLSQFVNEPTRLNNSSLGNILDLIFSSDPYSINIENYSAPIGSSDHCVINFNVYSNSVCDHSTSVVNNNPHSTNDYCLSTFDWSGADFIAINNYFNSVDWNIVFGFNFDADIIWNAFKSLIWPIIEMFVPKKSSPTLKSTVQDNTLNTFANS